MIPLLSDELAAKKRIREHIQWTPFSIPCFPDAKLLMWQPYLDGNKLTIKKVEDDDQAG